MEDLRLVPVASTSEGKQMKVTLPSHAFLSSRGLYQAPVTARSVSVVTERSMIDRPGQAATESKTRPTATGSPYPALPHGTELHNAYYLVPGSSEEIIPAEYYRQGTIINTWA